MISEIADAVALFGFEKVLLLMLGLAIFFHFYRQARSDTKSDGSAKPYSPTVPFVCAFNPAAQELLMIKEINKLHQSVAEIRNEVARLNNNLN